MLRKLAATQILNSALGSDALYVDPKTGEFVKFRVVIHKEFDELYGQTATRATEVSYYATADLNLAIDELLQIEEPSGMTDWRVSSVVGFNGSLTRVALKPHRGGIDGAC